MTQDPLTGLALVVVLGVACQVIGPRLRLPPILVLLVVGFAAGVTGLLDTDALLGELLFPVVSLSVAVILFEGALTLDVAELRGGVRRVVQRLLIIGVAVTGALVAGLALTLLRLPVGLAILLGAVLVVSGPTVVVPLLAFVGPVGRVGSILKWEGILVDPIGAILAVLVFEGLLAQQHGQDPPGIIVSFVLTIGVGIVVGLAGAVLLGLLLHAGSRTPQLDAPVTLAMVFAAFALSDALRAESGLVAVTLMGVALANQRRVAIERIEQFEATLGVILISVLFILLSARLSLAELRSIGWQGIVFVGLLILVVRPVAAVLASLRTELSWPERAFIGWLGPRGIVAASVASLFALELSDAGVPGAAALVPLTFAVIVGTVAVAALTAIPVAGALGLRGKPEPDSPARPGTAGPAGAPQPPDS